MPTAAPQSPSVSRGCRGAGKGQPSGRRQAPINLHGPWPLVPGSCWAVSDSYSSSHPHSHPHLESISHSDSYFRGSRWVSPNPTCIRTRTPACTRFPIPVPPLTPTPNLPPPLPCSEPYLLLLAINLLLHRLLLLFQLLRPLQPTA